MTTILLLGAGIMQIPAIRIAKSRGWRVVVADGNPDAEGKGLCDRFACVDLKDRDGLMSLARQCQALHGLDGVFTAGTDFSTSVAWVAAKMGLPGIPYEVALRATDKALMREAFARAGVPSPRFACWTGEGDPVGLVEAFQFPLVVKPVDNMGARGVRRVDDPAGIAAACREALLLSRSSRVILEEYMEGRELSLDAVVDAGRITVCGVADRHIFFPPYFVELGHTMPTDLVQRDAEAACEVFRAGIRALGIDRGAAKGDIKMTARGPMIGEIAARLSGGYMSGWTFPLASGVDVTGAALNVAAGLPAGDMSPRFAKVSAERALISIPGTVAEISGLERARSIPGVSELFLRTGPGSRVVFPRNNVEKCGNAISAHPDRRKAVEAAERAIQAVTIRLVPLCEATDRFLFVDGTDAFTMSRRANIDALAAMPSWEGNPSQARSCTALFAAPLAAIGDEPCRDWHGLSLAEAVRKVERECGIQLAARPGRDAILLGRVFWRAIVRGSVQGGMYLIDSVRRAAERGTLQRYLEGICG
ncbi:MAG: ATP-grasp domain-containing protein [Spirochaetes bacterium]|nr:ATP-grasp domain-containing protein [Spirochaetota bacterium]